MIEHILAFSTGLFGLTTLLIMVMFKSFKTNRISNGYLLIILLLVSTRYFINGIFGIYNISYINEIRDIVNNLFLIIFPLFLVYFKNLVNNTKRINLYDLKYFIVLFVFLIVDGIIRKFEYSNENLNLFYYLFFLSYTLYFMFMIFKLLKNNIWKNDETVKITFFENHLLYSWSIFLFVAFFLISSRLIIVIFSEIISILYNQTISTSFFWASAMVWIGIFIKILAFPEILYGYNFLAEKIEKNNKTEILISSPFSIESIHEISNLNDMKLELIMKNLISGYIKQLNSLDKEYKSFRNPNFSITDFSKLLNIKKSHLIYIFKYHSKISFPEYKRNFRIQDSINLIESNYLSKNTLEALSKEVGFMTYNTFYTSFKDVIGIIPNVLNKSYQKNNI
jgi:AraC-like DNA-binding protein